MVQFSILTGKKAGTVWAARCFPVRIGRGAGADLRVEEDGVWDQHLQLEFDPKLGFVLHEQPNVLATVNGQPVHATSLRNGDLIELGSLKMRFWLTPTRQAGLRVREGLTWGAIGAIALGQIALIYWLIRP